MGSSGRIFITSGYAFGTIPYTFTGKNATSYTVPANSNLMYNFKLINTKGTQFANDTSAIGNYISHNAIAVIKDKSGIRYTKINGTGSPIQPTDKIQLSYTLQVINSSQTLISANTPTSGNTINGQIAALRILLPLLSHGSMVDQLFVPSGLAYGSNGYGKSTVAGSIPPNANLLFTQLKVF